jgi:DNA processing protein
MSCLAEACISVIGSRRATPYGLAAAELAGRVAAECGLVVVTGGARGCDHAASMAALDAGGKAIVVPGSGADVIYPSSSADAFEGAVSSGGCVVSLEDWGAGPRRYMFVRRNSLIAALSLSLIVTEADLKSGTYSTASAALSLSRNIYAIPGSIFSPTSRGTNRLIESGAAIVPDEIALEQLIASDYDRLRLVDERPITERGRTLSALVASPSRPDELSEKMGCDVLTAIRNISDLEARGLVERLTDGRYSPTERALLGDNVRRA